MDGRIEKVRQIQNTLDKDWEKLDAFCADFLSKNQSTFSKEESDRSLEAVSLYKLQEIAKLLKNKDSLALNKNYIFTLATVWKDRREVKEAA